MKVLKFLCKVVEKMVFSGIDGTILILPLFALIWFMIGQAKDCAKVIRRVWREEAEDRVS